jgi:hypothetical protein
LQRLQAVVSQLLLLDPVWIGRIIAQCSCHTVPKEELIVYIIRNTFVAKPGMASKLAAQLKSMAGVLPGMRILTDVTGEFNHVVMEFEASSLADLESRMQQYGSDPEIRSKMQGYTDLWLTGSREILRVN